jgi:hypothetical protein
MEQSFTVASTTLSLRVWGLATRTRAPRGGATGARAAHADDRRAPPGVS